MWQLLFSHYLVSFAGMGAGSDECIHACSYR